MIKKTGLLLINLGSPDNTSLPAVRHYLNEFLMDPFVVDLPWAIRCLLVKGIILRTRPKNSAHAYQQIWTDQGSPLITNSEALKNSIAQSLPQHVTTELGMRYGKPSIAHALKKLMAHDIEHLIVLPLFPQYSEAATGSAIHAFNQALKSYHSPPTLNIVRDFYNHPWFIDAYTTLIQTHFKDHPDDFLLMSYHGLPIRHLEKIGCPHIKTACLNSRACPVITQDNPCYRAQCYETSRLITQKLNLSEKKYAVAFQSRLGRTPWIKPYTDELLIKLREQGIDNIVIACPSFVADCLETLEEIGIRAKEQWTSLGGKRLTLLPCINGTFPNGHSLIGNYL